MFGISRFSMIARPLVARQQVPSSSIFLQQTAEFSKYISKARAKRLPLTTKKAGKGYYKGNGSRKEGYITSKGMSKPTACGGVRCADKKHLSFSTFCLLVFTGKFIRVPDMVTELVTPDFSQFKLKPYVAVEARRNKIDVWVNRSLSWRAAHLSLALDYLQRRLCSISSCKFLIEVSL